MTKNGYQDAVLVSFTATPPDITTANHTGKEIFSPSLIKRKGFAKKISSPFGVTYRIIRGVGIKRQVLNAKYDRSFWSS